MSSANVIRMRKLYEPRIAAVEKSGHVRDLVFLREVLAEYGATPSELREYDAVIDRARKESAAQARRRATPFPTAA